jgi:hypothetical protein
MCLSTKKNQSVACLSGLKKAGYTLDCRTERVRRPGLPVCAFHTAAHTRRALRIIVAFDSVQATLVARARNL